MDPHTADYYTFDDLCVDLHNRNYAHLEQIHTSSCSVWIPVILAHLHIDKSCSSCNEMLYLLEIFHGGTVPGTKVYTRCISCDHCHEI